jgi:glutamyl-tRNA(Gln) amidotransferase subunit E
MKNNWYKVGFRAGLEIHQQLDGTKLFCSCIPDGGKQGKIIFERRFRPTQSELREIDKAAITEAKRNLKFRYIASHEYSCGVEADEEPPHDASGRAVESALLIALMLNSKPVDLIQWMRKVVIDGSNTAGFQRTGLVALKGKIDSIEIDTIALEEDSARKIGRKGKTVIYNLDRLGTPLIEISTASTIRSPDEVERVAGRIGAVLRATGRIRRGLGTIRQDLNLSIKEGARVEIKGVQNLRSLKKVAEKEVERQVSLIHVKDILRSRNAKVEDIKKAKAIEITDLISEISDRTDFKKLLGKKLFAIPLKGFSGMLEGEGSGKGVLWDELNQRTTADAESQLLASSDRIDKGVRRIVIEKLKLGGNDAFILATGKKSTSLKALQIAKERAELAFKGVVEEVRGCLPDCRTKYLRPLPGAARMYPETDIPPIRVDPALIQRLAREKPELPEIKFERFLKKHRLDKEQAKQLFDQGLETVFEELSEEFDNCEREICRILLNIIPEIQEDGTNVDDEQPVREVLLGYSEGKFSKEGLDPVLSFLYKNPGKGIDDAVKACNLSRASAEDVRETVKKVIEEKRELVSSQKDRSFSPLMGILMKRFRGKIDGKLIAKILKEELEKK